jgi:hypothetical protein
MADIDQGGRMPARTPGFPAPSAGTGPHTVKLLNFWKFFVAGPKEATTGDDT